jgi:hypothetical protein
MTPVPASPPALPHYAALALLLAACSGTPAPPPAPPRSPPLAASAHASSDPRDLPTGLGPAVLVTHAPAAGQALSIPPIEQATTPGAVAGLFLLGLETDRLTPPDGRINRYSVRTHGCLLRGNPSCNYLRLRTREPEGSPRWRPFAAVPADYNHVLLGRTRAFLRAESGESDILGVGFDGTTSVWMPAPGEPQLAETATWLVTEDQPVFAYRLDQAIRLHTRATAGAEPVSAPFLSRFVWLDYEAPIADTRALAAKHARFAYRLTLTTSLDAAGEPDPGIVAAWIEYLLPAIVPKSLGARDDEPWTNIGMNVPRRLHLARITLDGRVTDHAELSPAATHALFAPEDESYLVPPGSMAARPVPGGFVLENAMLDGKLAPKPGGAPDPPDAPAFPALDVEALQRVCAVGYDAAAQEGLVVACEPDRALAQRFDARGDLVGPPLSLAGPLAASLSRRGVVRLDEGWIGASSDGGRVIGLSVGVAGLQITVPRDADTGSLAAVTGGPAGIDLLFVNDFSGAVQAAHVDVARRVAKPPGLLADRVDLPSSFIRSLASPRIIADPRGGQWLFAKTDGRYQALHRTPEGSIDVRRDLGEAVSLDLVAVSGDVVALLHRSAQDDALEGLWLDQEQSAALPLGRPSRTAPLLTTTGGEAFFLPPSAAAPAPLPRAVASELFDCEDVFPTGPRTAVLVCTEPPEAPRLGRRVALRPLGIDISPPPSPTK